MTQSPHDSRASTGTVYDIRWNEVCPSLILVRALRVSVMLRVLGLAMVGVVLTHWGWSMVDHVFPGSAPKLARLAEQPISAGLGSDWSAGLTPSHVGMEMAKANATPTLLDSAGLVHWGGPLAHAWAWLSEPFVRSARHSSGWRQSITLSLSGIWAILVWALFGGAISRIAALHLTRGETPGPWSALKGAFQKWAASAGAPLIPLLGAAVLAIPMMFAGLLLRADLMALVIGLVWILVIVWGFVLAVILVGLLIGWPLMWATIGVERTDAFDGVSRCYAYVYQRPLHLAFYIALALVLGWIGQFVVVYFAMAALSLGEWAVSWGAGGERIAELTVPTGGEAPAWNILSGVATTGASGIRFWKSALQVLVASYALAYLWPAAVGIYLLLRRQVDSTEMDEVAVDEGTQGLPPLQDHASGVPSVEPADSDNTESGNTPAD